MLVATAAPDVPVEIKRKVATCGLRFQKRLPPRRGSLCRNSTTLDQFCFCVAINVTLSTLHEDRGRAVVPHRFWQLPRHASPFTAPWIEDFHSPVYGRGVIRRLPTQCKHTLLHCSLRHVRLYCRWPIHVSMLGESCPQVRRQAASRDSGHCMAHSWCPQRSCCSFSAQG